MPRLEVVKLEDIRENPDAIRMVNRQGEDYIGLVDSIKNVGFRGTITVREGEEGGVVFYVVVDGMHRYLAAQDAGLTEVPCDIAELGKVEALEYSIMGNVHKKDTVASEYRKGLLDILTINPMMTEGDLAARLSKSTTWVGDILRLNKIESLEIMALVDSGEITLSNAYALAKLPTDDQLTFMTDAQTMAPDEFLPKVSARAKEIRDAKRAGSDPDAITFQPAEYMQKMKDIKEQRDSGEVADALIAETGISTAKEGFTLALNYTLHMDPFSVAEQQAKFDAKQAEKAAKAKAKAVETAAKKKAKAEEAVKVAVANEAAATEAAAAE